MGVVNLLGFNMTLKKNIVLSSLIIVPVISVAATNNCSINKDIFIKDIDKTSSNAKLLNDKAIKTSWLSNSMKSTTNSTVTKDFNNLTKLKSYIQSVDLKTINNDSCSSLNQQLSFVIKNAEIYSKISTKIDDINKESSKIKSDSGCYNDESCNTVLTSMLEKSTSFLENKNSNLQCSIEQATTSNLIGSYVNNLNSFINLLNNTSWLNKNNFLINSSKSELTQLRPIYYLSKNYTKEQFNQNCQKYTQLTVDVKNNEAKINSMTAKINEINTSKAKIIEDSKCSNEKDCQSILSNTLFQSYAPNKDVTINPKLVPQNTEKIVSQNAPKQDSNTLSKIAGAVSQSQLLVK